MDDAWHLAKIKGFEQVTAAPGIALLRVAAKPPRRHPRPGSRPVLLADDGRVVNRYPALPSPMDPRGVLRSAYSVPADFVTPATIFSLELEDGAILSLPAPQEGAARAIPGGPGRIPSPADPAADDDPNDWSWTPVPAPAPGERRVELMARVVELSASVARAEREAAEQRTVRVQADARVDAAEARAADAEARCAASDARGERADLEADTARDEADKAAARLRALERDIDQRLAEAVKQGSVDANQEYAQERAQLQARTEAAVAAEREALAQAASDRETFAGFERRINGLEISLQEHGDQIASLETQLAEAIRTRDELEREVVSLRKERTRLERELHDALDSVRKMAVERDELGRQAAAFDQVAIKARERATEAETAHQRSQAVLSELETWRGELERRLSSMSTELGEARTRLTDNDSELDRLRSELAEAEARTELAQARIIALDDSAGTDQETTVVDTAELNRMTGELASLRAESAKTDQELDAATSARIRTVESERDALTHRVTELTTMLEQAQRPAEASQELSRTPRPADWPEPARPPGARVQEAPPGPPAAPAARSQDAFGAGGLDLSNRSPEEQAAIADLCRRAEAEAEAIAVRELAQSEG